jgi:hypothetical protein
VNKARGANTHSITTFSITTTPSVKTFSTIIKKWDTQHDDIQCLCSSVVMLSVVMLSVVMLNVVVPGKVVEILA